MVAKCKSPQCPPVWGHQQETNPFFRVPEFETSRIIMRVLCLEGSHACTAGPGKGDLQITRSAGKSELTGDEGPFIVDDLCPQAG